MRPVAGWRRPPLRWSLRLEEEGEVPRALRRLGQPHRLRLCRLRRRLEVALPRLDGALLERADARRHRLAVGRGHGRSHPRFGHAAHGCAVWVVARVHATNKTNGSETTCNRNSVFV
mgnify:CR=1 FL=1